MCQCRHTSIPQFSYLPASVRGKLAIFFSSLAADENTTIIFAHSYLPASSSRLKHKPLPKVRVVTSEADFLYISIEVLTIHPAIARRPFVVDVPPVLVGC